MVVPADVVQAARDGDLAVVEAYFASEPRDVEDDCEIGPGMTMPVPLLHVALAPSGPRLTMDQDGKYRIVEMLLARGADPNRRNQWGYTAFATSVSQCQKDCTPRQVKLLLESGADARVMGYERTLGGSASLVGLLLRRVCRALNSGVARPLKNHLECLKLLLRAGSSLDNCRTRVHTGTVYTSLGTLPGHREPPMNAEQCMQDTETDPAASWGERDGERTGIRV